MTHTNSELQTRQQLWYDRPAVYWRRPCRWETEGWGQCCIPALQRIRSF